MRTHWIWLAHRPHVSDRLKAVLLRHFLDAEDIYYADGNAFDPIEGMTEEAKEALKDKDLTQTEQILEACSLEKLQVLTFQDAAYPKRLKNIPDPPLVLYYKGNLPDFDDVPVIGVVGTRKASMYGLTTAKRMGYQIAKCGGVVVSGMAYGIDGMAMTGALSAGGKAVGILGCGADIVYPLSNRALFADTQRYGCLLSEFPPGTPPHKWNFPRRNRIISGLSNGVLVVEAPEKSGSLITARLAADQGRDVFAVPGNIDIPSFAGSNQLLRDGAIMAGCGWDVIGEYQPLYPGKVCRDNAPAIQTAYPDEVRKAATENPLPDTKVAQKPKIPEKKPSAQKKIDKKVIDKAAQPPYSDVKDTKPSLSGDEQAVLDALEAGERLVDDVIAQTGLSAGKMLATLTILELKGIIRRLPGKRIVRK